MASNKIGALIASAVVLGSALTGASTINEVNAVEMNHSASPLIQKGDKKLNRVFDDALAIMESAINEKSLEMVEVKNNRIIEEQIIEELERKTQGTNYRIIPGTNESYTLTAYTMEEEGWAFGGIAADFKTKMYEASLIDRYIAVDRNKTPLGTKLYIEFPEDIRYITYNGVPFDLNGVYTAVDVGGAIKGNKIDLYVGSFGQQYVDLAYKIGRRNVQVYQVEEK